MNILKYLGTHTVIPDGVGSIVPNPDPYVFVPPGSGSVIICTNPASHTTPNPEPSIKTSK